MCWNNWWDMYNQQYMEYCIGVSEHRGLTWILLGIWLL